MSKVFRDFGKIIRMKNSAVIGIIGGISIVIVLGIVFTFNEESETIEIEDVFNREIIQDEESTSEVQEQLDEIEKINLEEEYSPQPREWITSGPFQIDRSEYVIGEKIFVIIGGLQYNEKGQIVFLRP
ncbi:MAG: hypothetical protein OEW86_10655, partial [Nitrosopumilus sp.]|nr:hypothetical protein [Nitrosopumilus sp.]